MVNLFQINLEPPPSSGAYISGSQLSGRVVVETGEPKSYELIEVSLVGTGKVKWETGSGEDTERHSAKEEYLNESVALWSDEGQSRMLTTGRHEFPFTLSIPESCPPTYEKKGSSNSKAWIHYVVKGRIANKSLLKVDHTVEKQITIRRQVRLDHTTAEPVTKENEATDGWFCCVSGPVVLMVELPYSGFVVGDRIPLSINLENGSSRNLRVEACLVNKVQYKAGASRLNESHTVLKEYSNHFSGRSTVTWTPETLTVPDVPVTMETPGGMISSSYEVQVKVSLQLLQTLKVTFPVIIGDVPFCNTL